MLDVLARLSAPLVRVVSLLTGVTAEEEPRADVIRYDSLRALLAEEAPHVH